MPTIWPSTCMATEYLVSHADHFQDRKARKQIVILISPPFTKVDGKGLKTKYSNVVATLKLKIYQTHRSMNAFFQRFDIRILFLMTAVTLYVKCKLI